MYVDFCMILSQVSQLYNMLSAQIKYSLRFPVTGMISLKSGSFSINRNESSSETYFIYVDMCSYSRVPFDMQYDSVAGREIDMLSWDDGIDNRKSITYRQSLTQQSIAEMTSYTKEYWFSYQLHRVSNIK